MELNKNLTEEIYGLIRRMDDFATEDIIETLCELVEEFDGTLYLSEFARYLEPVRANDNHSYNTEYTYRVRRIVAVIAYPLDDCGHVELYVRAEKLNAPGKQEELPFCGDADGGIHNDLIQFNASKIFDVVLGYYYSDIAKKLASKRHKYELTSAKRLTALLEADSTDAEDKSIIAEILAERKKRATDGHSI